MFRTPAIALCLPGLLLLGCAAEAPSTELVIDHADDAGMSGEYRTPGATIHFESYRDAADGPVTARFFDDRGAVLASRFPGTVAPVGWSHDEPLAEALALLPAATDALGSAELPTSGLELQRGVLIDLAGEPTDDRPPEILAATSWIIFGIGCGTHEEFGAVGAWNPSYTYSRWASNTFYDGWGTSTYSGWVGPQSSRYFTMGTYKLGSAYASGSLSFWNGGNWCGTQVIARANGGSSDPATAVGASTSPNR